MQRVAADQQGAGDAREGWRERVDAALLGLAAGNPDQAVVAGQRSGGSIGVGGLAVVDEGYTGNGGDALLAVRQAGEGCERGRDDVRPLAGGDEAHGDGDGGSGVLRIVRAGSAGASRRSKSTRPVVPRSGRRHADIVRRREVLVAGDMDAAAKLGGKARRRSSTPITASRRGLPTKIARLAAM